MHPRDSAQAFIVWVCHRSSVTFNVLADFFFFFLHNHDLTALEEATDQDSKQLTVPLMAGLAFNWLKMLNKLHF